jgi:hypothetical protein
MMISGFAYCGPTVQPAAIATGRVIKSHRFVARANERFVFMTTAFIAPLPAFF